MFTSRLMSVAAVAGVVTATPLLAKDLVIHAGRLIGGVSAQPRNQVSILLHDDRITGVQSGFVTPPGRKSSTCRIAVRPGLIDCHVHLTGQFDGGNPIAEAVTETRFDSAGKSTAYARATLLAGFTRVRDVDADTGVIVALKKQIAKGIVAFGPPAGARFGPLVGFGYLAVLSGRHGEDNDFAAAWVRL